MIGLAEVVNEEADQAQPDDVPESVEPLFADHLDSVGQQIISLSQTSARLCRLLGTEEEGLLSDLGTHF